MLNMFNVMGVSDGVMFDFTQCFVMTLCIIMVLISRVRVHVLLVV